MGLLFRKCGEIRECESKSGWLFDPEKTDGCGREVFTLFAFGWKVLYPVETIRIPRFHYERVCPRCAVAVEAKLLELELETKARQAQELAATFRPLDAAAAVLNSQGGTKCSKCDRPVKATSERWPVWYDVDQVDWYCGECKAITCGECSLPYLQKLKRDYGASGAALKKALDDDRQAIVFDSEVVPGCAACGKKR